MTQAYLLPAVAPAGAPRVAQRRARARRPFWSSLVRLPLVLAGLAWRVTFRLFKLLVLLPLALALAFVVWFAVRLIRG